MEPLTAAPQSSWAAGPGTSSGKHGALEASVRPGQAAAPAMPSPLFSPHEGGRRAARRTALCPAGKPNPAMWPRELKGSREPGDAATPSPIPVSEAGGAGRGRRLHLPLVTQPCPARPPSCKMAAAVESSDSEEEDLVSYGSALQPLQEGKGSPGGSSAPPLFLCQCIVASAGE